MPGEIPRAIPISETQEYLGYAIEQATEAEVPEIHYLLETEAKDKTVLARPIEEIQAIVQSPYDRFFVCKVEGRVAGCVSVEFYDTSNPHYLPLAEERSLALNQDYRGLKMGKPLHQRAVEELVTRKVDQAFVTTNIPGFFPEYGEKHKGKDVVWKHPLDTPLIYADFMRHLANLRHSHPEDRAAILTLCEQARHSQQLTPKDVLRIDHLLDSFIVYEQEDGTVAGCISCKRYNGRITQLDELTVREDLRGQGIGSALAWQTRALTDGYSRDVFAATNNISFWSKLGHLPDETGKSIRWLNS